MEAFGSGESFWFRYEEDLSYSSIKRSISAISKLPGSPPGASRKSALSRPEEGWSGQQEPAAAEKEGAGVGFGRLAAPGLLAAVAGYLLMLWGAGVLRRYRYGRMSSEESLPSRTASRTSSSPTSFPPYTTLSYSSIKRSISAISKLPGSPPGAFRKNALSVQGFCVPVQEGETAVFSNMAHAWPEAYLEGVGWVPFELPQDTSHKSPLCTPPGPRRRPILRSHTIPAAPPEPSAGGGCLFGPDHGAGRDGSGEAAGD